MHPSQQKALIDNIAIRPAGRSVEDIQQSIANIQAEKKKLQAEIDEIRSARAAREKAIDLS